MVAPEVQEGMAATVQMEAMVVMEDLCKSSCLKQIWIFFRWSGLLRFKVVEEVMLAKMEWEVMVALVVVEAALTPGQQLTTSITEITMVTVRQGLTPASTPTQVASMDQEGQMVTQGMLICSMVVMETMAHLNTSLNIPLVLSSISTNMI